MIRFSLRLPKELHQTLKTWAHEEGRSLHGHVLYLIRQALRDRSD